MTLSSHDPLLVSGEQEHDRDFLKPMSQVTMCPPPQPLPAVLSVPTGSRIKNPIVASSPFHLVKQQSGCGSLGGTRCRGV